MRVMKAHDLKPSSPLVCFCEVVARDPFYLVGRHHRPEFQLRELASLRFARVAEVATPWMCLQQDLREQGVDLSRLDRAGPAEGTSKAWLLRQPSDRKSTRLNSSHLGISYAVFC